MMTGYSKLFFKYPDWWGTENKKAKERNESTSTSTSTENWCTSFDFSKCEKIVEPKNSEIDLISRSLTFNYSMYLPYSPIVFSGVNGGQYEKFLGESGSGKHLQAYLMVQKKLLMLLNKNI